MGLGDIISEALSTVGITPERVEDWLGAPCGCEERRQKLNALGFWATRVLKGKAQGARAYLEEILYEDSADRRPGDR
jgi:hypothetical protein